MAPGDRFTYLVRLRPGYDWWTGRPPSGARPISSHAAGPEVLGPTSTVGARRRFAPEGDGAHQGAL